VKKRKALFLEGREGFWSCFKEDDSEENNRGVSVEARGGGVKREEGGEGGSALQGKSCFLSEKKCSLSASDPWRDLA